MGKILKALANGDFCTQTITENRSPEHQKACDKAYTLFEQMEKRLDGEERELLDKAFDSLTTEHCYSEANQFVRGFRLGALIMLEILENREEFCSQFGA